MAQLHLLLLLLLIPFLLTDADSGADELPSDAIALLSFKSAADLDSKLIYSHTERFDYCQWQGVKCARGRVVRLSLPGAALRGTFPPGTLSRIDQLRILSLQNNSLYGPVPDLSGLVNLKSLFLANNGFYGSFPASILSIHGLRVLDLQFDNFSGLIPAQITGLGRLEILRLEFNRFTGPLPPLNQTLLKAFNVSGNRLTGKVPITTTLSRFDASSYFENPDLCGVKVNRPCSSGETFFGGNSSGPAPLEQSSQGTVVVVGTSPPAQARLKKPKRIGFIVGFTMGVVLIVAAAFIVLSLIRARGGEEAEVNPKELAVPATGEADDLPTAVSNEKTVDLIIEAPQRVNRSGYLNFCAGEAELYTLEQLMRASAELLGRGTMGTTYKAVLDNHLIMTVKRLDSSKTAAIGEEAFERHIDAVGGMRHPNLVPLRAHFQAQGERLVIFDYQPNGSLHNLIHGSKTARSKPLHWTSCLKIADDVAQGLAYLHGASRLIHGNIKSSNVLLGADFEACLTDYCLSILLTDNSPAYDDLDSAAYRAPETRKSWRRATAKSDVYAFGVLLLELLTGKHPSQHPFVALPELPEWVRTVREEGGSESGSLEMLVEVAGVCRLNSPEQRPAMREVVKMVSEIKESLVGEDGSA